MNELPMLKKQFFLYLLSALSAIGFYWLCYKTPRESFYLLIGLYGLLFAAYYYLFRVFSLTHFKYLLVAGMLFRVILLFSIPNLSDDVFRFIWDGRLAANGINPFRHLPSEIMQMPQVKGITSELFAQLNSQQHYTIYPPVLQGIFWLAGKLFPVNVYAAILFLKCIIFIIESGTIFLLMQLLKKLSLPANLSLLYILNPLVITELTGNAHFEGAIIFFVLLSFLLIFKNKWQVSALGLSLGIATKLVPVIFLPLIMFRLGLRKGLLYCLITGVTTIILFAVLFDEETIKHLFNSVDLFFRKFEFNASVYYFVRWIGSLLTGYNIIAVAGPVLCFMATGIILFLSFRNQKISNQVFLVKALFIVTTWYLFSTTVHPWYICLPVALAVFTPYRFAIIWSFTATLSYAAYQFNPVKENLWFIGAGYIFMIGYAWWELKKTHTLTALKENNT